MDEWMNRYQDTFSHLSAPPQVQEAVTRMRPGTRSPRYVRRLSAAMAALLLLLALLGCGAAAVAYGENIQSLFARRWQQLTGQSMEESQSAFLDHLSQEIGQSQTVNGVTVTLDSAAVGADVFYLLVRVETDGGSCSFDQFDLAVAPDPLAGLEGMGGCGWSSQGTDAQGRPLLLFTQSYLALDSFAPDARPLALTLTLTDLYQGTGTVEGTWQFQVSLDRTQIPRPVSLPDTWATVADIFTEEEATGHFTNIQVSSTGLRYDQRFPDEENPDFLPTLVLRSGAEIPGGNGNGIRIREDGTLRCSVQWNIPVDLEEAVCVRLGDTDLPIP